MQNEDSTYNTGVRKIVDDYLLEESKKRRDYGDYWSASSAGYCHRKVIFDRLQIPHVKDDPRKQRVFTAGHIFHNWMQELTRNAGISIAQEVELQDDDLMVRGHFDDLVLVGDLAEVDSDDPFPHSQQKLILYDYKTQSSRAFSYQKGGDMSYFHRLQLGTYMYMLRASKYSFGHEHIEAKNLTEARILKISKDDLRMSEQVLLWSESLNNDVQAYWNELNTDWQRFNVTGALPPCTCADHEGGFLAKEAYNDYYYNDAPCSIDWFNENYTGGK